MRLSAAEIFPNLSIQKVGQLSECSRDVIRQAGGFLVFGEAHWAAITQARVELDDSGLPRWAVVVCGSGVADAAQPPVDVISSADENQAGVSRVLRLAWDRHILRRENARMRGEMLTFGTRITHDLRTPLGGVLTTAEMLGEILGEDAPQDVPLIQPILDSTDGLVKLIERSSAFARATTTLEPPRRFDMGIAFWNAFQRLESLLVKSKHTLIQPPGWPSVVAHESGMEWVWRTLLANAIQHGAEGGQIEAGWTEEAEGTRFWVRNDGTVAPEKRATLFTPFHRLHEPNAPRGLGLPLMRRLVEIEGGQCGFDSPGVGAVEFYFVLPGHSSA